MLYRKVTTGNIIIALLFGVILVESFWVPNRRSVVSNITNTGNLQIRFSSGEGKPIGFILVEVDDTELFKRNTRFKKYGGYIRIMDGEMYGYDYSNSSSTGLVQRNIGNKIIAYGFDSVLECDYEVQGIKLICTKHMTSSATSTYDAQEIIIWDFNNLCAKYNTMRYRALAILRLDSADYIRAIALQPYTYIHYMGYFIIMTIVVLVIIWLNQRYRFLKMITKHRQCINKRIV